MTIEAELADGRILEFPDGTDTAVIQGVVSKLMSGGAPPSAPPATWTGGVLPDKQLQQLETDANAGDTAAQNVLRAYKKATAPAATPTGGRFLTQAEGARQFTGSARPAPAPVQKQVQAKPAFSLLNNDSLGNIDEIKSRTDTRSALEKAPALPPAPAQAAVNTGAVNPEYVEALQAQLNAMPAAQRNFVLQQAIKANPDNVKGRALRLIAERYAAMDKVESPTLQKLKPTLENVKAQIAKQFPGRAKMYPELIEQDAIRAISRGQLEDNSGQLSADVVGEQAAAAAEARAKELKGAGFLRRVGAGAASEVTKSGMGILNIYADALEGSGLIRSDIGKKLGNERRIEEARIGAIPQGESILEKSAQGAMTSLATQGPLMALSVVTGTAAPVLAQAFVQKLGDSYGEGKAAGLSGKAAFARAMPMATAEVFFERFGMTKALAGLREHVAKYGVQSVSKYMTEAIAREIPPELATTLTQYGIDVLPGVGLNKNPNLVDLYKQLEETLRQTVLQAGVTSAVTVGGVKAAQKGKEALTKFLPEQRESYTQQNYEELIKSKGFDFKPKQELGTEKVDTGAEGPALGEGQIDTGVEGPAMGEGQIDTGTAGPALGEFTLEEATASPAPPAAAASTTADTTSTVPPADVDAIAEQLIANGVPSALAQRMAEKQVKKEAEKQVAEQTQGAENVTGIEPPPSGGSAGVVSESVAGEPAGGLETPTRDGVVSTESDAGVAATGEVSKPAAIKELTEAEQEASDTVFFNGTSDKVIEDLTKNTDISNDFREVAVRELQRRQKRAETDALNALTQTTNFPATTEGTPASVTTPTETKQAKTQRKQAPAATGRKDVHTVAQGAEGKWDHTVNAAVVNSYDTKRQATAASLLDKAQKAGDPANIAQRQKAFDDAMNPNPRGKPPMLMVNGEFGKPKTETTEAVEGGQELTETAEGQPAVTNIDEAIKSYRGDPDVAAGILADDLVGQTHLTAEIRRIAKTYLADGEDAGRTQFKESLQNPDSGFALLGLTQPEIDTYFKELDQYLTEKVNIFKAEPATETKAKAPATEPTREEDNNRLNQLIGAVDRAKKQLLKDENLASDDPKLLATRERLAKAKAEYEQFSPEIYARDLARTKESIEQFEARQTEKAKEEAEKAATETKKAPSAADALSAETQEQLQELEDLLGNYNTNPDQLSARTSAKNIARMAKDPAQPKAVRERAKEILADEIDSKDLSSKANSAPPDTAFSKFTTAAQAISHILRTGTKFEKALASRLRSFVQGVKFVVVERDSPLPDGLVKRIEQWDNSIAMYVESKGERTIYVRGDSFGTSHGISKEPVLHELLHAATAKKINLAMKAIKEGANLDSPLVQAALALQRTMQNADTSLNELARKGEMSQELEHLAKAGKAFTDLNEFVSYGITNKAMQNHLINTVGVEGDTHLFNRFVDSIRRMFGMGLDNVNALSDLILATDQLLSAREIGTTKEVGAFSAITPKDDQTELNKRVDEALKKAEISRDGEKLGSAVDNLASYRDPRYMWGEVKGVWDTLTDPAKSAVSRFYDSEALAYAGPGDIITGLKDAHEAIQKMSGSVQAYLRSTANVADEIVDFYRAEPKKREAFAELLNASTDARYDPANPNNTLRSKRLDDAYADLGKQGQAAYRRLRDYYKTMNAVKQHLIEENLDSLELPEEARKKLLSDVRVMFEADKIEPYFPLARFGDFVLEIGKINSPKKQKYRFDTKSERDRAARGHAAKQGTTVDALTKDGDLRTSEDINGNNLRTDIEAASDLLKKSYAAIDGASVTDPYLKQNLKDSLYQAYLGAMPENSVRKNFIHRKGTPGYSSDVLRALNDSGSKMARAFAKLEHGNDIRKATALAERQLVGNGKYTAFVKRMQEIADEALQPRIPHDVMQWADTAANVIVKVSFIRNLTSMSSALMQPMDIVMKGVPVLTGNHGPKAMVELSKMMKLNNQYGFWEKMPNGTTRFRAPSIEFAKGLTPQERKAVRDMVEVYGVTRDTLANEVFSKARTPAVKVRSKAFEVGKDAVDALVLGGLMHHAERLSREVIALTSFRLHLAELQKASPGNPMNYHEAVKAAIQETNEVLGNYNANNKPMIMRGGVGRVVTMYKFFPLLTTKLLVINFFKMLPGLNKQGKVAAATKFFGVLSTHALFAGLVALPAFSLVTGLLQAAWEKWQKDPDAPDDMRDIDAQTWFRTEVLPSYFGNPELARMAEYGVLQYATGWGISPRLALNDMWFRDAQPGRTVKETALNWGQVAGGAAWSTGVGMAEGIELMTQGEYERGLEKIMPASISKFMVARRYAEEGVQTPQGVQLVGKGKLSTSELVGQTIGFAPANVLEAQEAAFKYNAAEKVIVREREKIMGTLKDSFRKSVDPSKSVEIHERFDKIYRDTLDKTVDFSLRHPEYEFKDGEIDKAIKDELNRVLETEIGSGIRMTEKNTKLATPSIDKAEKALAPYKK